MLILVATCLGRTIRFPLNHQSDVIHVGSLATNQLHLPYKGVSRNHFTLNCQNQTWILTDLGSTNGTLVNGNKVKEIQLKQGDLIQVGIVELSLQDADEDKIVKIPEENLNSAFARTDKMNEIASVIAGNLFISDRLVFPHGMIPGTSPKMMELFQRLHSLTDSDVNVMLIGETGSGKEMIAQTLHYSGNRSRGPFIAINCGAIPAELIETELFGIGDKVATDVGARTGKFVLANHGTLFLDELSAFPMALQAKILRVIDERKITPVGKSVPEQVDFRLICATNEDPQHLIKSGRLREDLYHRVGTVELLIPALRDRKEDLPLLIVGLIQQICKKEKKAIAGISDRLFEALVSYSYPGNMRELINVLNSMVVLAHPGEVLDVHLAPDRLIKSTPSRDERTEAIGGPFDLRNKLDETSKDLILRALHLNDWNISAAARSLKVTRFGLQKMMKRLRISDKR